MKAKDYLTFKHLLELEASKQCFVIYPRKHMVCVNGFKYYNVNAGTMNRWIYYQKTRVAIQ